MAVNQYVPKYIDCKIITKKDDGDKGFLEKDHFNAVEDNYLFKDARIGNGIIPSGTNLIDIINYVADEAIIGKNRIDSISVNHITQPIDINKNVDITVPTKLSDLAEDESHRVTTDNEKAIWNAKQNAVAWESDNYDPISNKAITKSDLDSAVAPLARTTHWRGVFNSLSEVTDPKNGDIAAVGYKEYVYCSEQTPPGWRELGDEDSYIHKGEVTNNDIKTDAAIAQSKIAGLVDALNEKVVKESGKSLVLDTEIAKIHSHTNKETLDNITQTAWETVVTNSNQVPNKVDKSTTIAGVNLEDNINKEEMLTALNVEDGAQVNKLEEISVNGKDVEIINKKASLKILSSSPYPASFDTSHTTLEFCKSIANTQGACAGMTYLGGVTLTDMPFAGNSEVIVSVMTGGDDPDLTKVIILEMFSTNVAPYHWYSMYWGNMKTGTASCPWQAILSVDKDNTSEYLPTKDHEAANKKYVDNVANTKVSKEDNKSLVSDSEIAKLATVEENAKDNIIENVTVNDCSASIANKLATVIVDNLKADVQNKVYASYSDSTKKPLATEDYTYSKDEIDSKLSSVYKYKGTVEKFENLPTTGMIQGDTYNVKTAHKTEPVFEAGSNLAWVDAEGEVAGHWDVLAGIVDLSNYYTKNEVDTSLSGKVNTETNKSLVDNSEIAKLATVEENAEKNIIESIQINGTDLTIDADRKASGLVKSTLPIPDTISYTNMTSLQFCNKICELDTCKVGVIYSGYSKITDAPCTGCEVTVSVMKDEGFSKYAKVLILHMNSTNHAEKSWITMYHNQEMKYGTVTCPWESQLLTPVSTSGEADDYIGASKKYVDDAIATAISKVIWTDSDGAHIKISDDYSLNISSTGTITATYPGA